MASPVGWWNAASWTSSGNASGLQWSQKALKKWNLKSLIFFDQQLKGEEEKGRRVEEQESEKMPFCSRFKQNHIQETLAV